MLSITALACGKPKTPHGAEDLRSVDELRARALIQETLATSGLKALAGTEEPLGDKKVEVDVWIDGERYGIAYVAEDEEGVLGSALPKAAGKMLPLLTLEGGRNVLVLYAHDYQYDAGASHATTSVTAERKIKRDVTDFAVQVVKKK